MFARNSTRGIVDLLYGPTYGNTIILNKNKIQDCVGRHLRFLHRK